MIILLSVLLVLGGVARILLDRKQSSGIENRIVSFTCTLPAGDASQLAAGSMLYTEDDNLLGTVSDIRSTEEWQEGFGDNTENYTVVTGTLTVRGYQTKSGVFCTTNGEELRINTVLNLKNGEGCRLYINNIVENGQ